MRWMQKSLPSELPELLARHQRCRWPGVVLMEDNSAPVYQRWPLLHECCIQAVQLLAVKVRIERLAIGEQLIVDDSLPIPPNTQKNLPGRQSRLGHRLGSLTAFRLRPFALHVVVSDPFFIASLHPLQKRVDFVAIQKRFACIHTGKNVFFASSRVAPIRRASF